MPGGITAHGLVKRYGDVTALDGLDLTVPEGTVLGLLGPNGAGKTTAVRIFTTLLEPDTGTATVDGIDVTADPDGVRERIGLSGQNAAVDEYLTGFENLDMVGRLYHLGRAPSRERAPRAARRLPAVPRRRPPRAHLLRWHAAPPRPGGGPRGPSRPSSSSTNRPRVWTRAAASTCGTSSATWSRAAPRCCSPPSTSRRPTAWPTTSSSSTRAGPSPRARPTSSRARSVASASSWSWPGPTTSTGPGWSSSATAAARSRSTSGPAPWSRPSPVAPPRCGRCSTTSTPPASTSSTSVCDGPRSTTCSSR